eukprot:TRINITY_DN2864_c0_g1_i4.p1 TRINITY_DN2864_c0_g1~~TRINITY_DN2864_c0_g1_i4.p1  ORF type:complete len:403 (-),score=104.57 TRINITY_DN2864_c0_g1_i4:97-1260(-)
MCIRDRDNNDVDLEMKIQYYRKVQEATEIGSVDVTRNKKQNRRMCNCASQGNIVITKTARPSIKVVKLKHPPTPLAPHPRIVKHPAKRITSRRTTLVTPLSLTFAERNPARVVNGLKAEKKLAPREINAKMCKESTTDYPSDGEGDVNHKVNQLLMTSFNNKAAKDIPLDPLLDKMYPKEPIHVTFRETTRVNIDKSKEETKILRELGILEWSDEEDSEDELQELYGRHNGNSHNSAKPKPIGNHTVRSGNEVHEEVKLAGEKKPQEKLFEGNMYLDNCNHLVQFLMDEDGNVTVKMRNIVTNEKQSVLIERELVPNVLKANSKNMVAGSIDALAKFLTSKRAKDNMKAHEEGTLLTISMKGRTRDAGSKLGVKGTASTLKNEQSKN